MRTVKSNKLTKRIISYLMALALIVSMVPFSAFITNAEPTPTMDGTFESYTLDEMPTGWTAVALSDYKGEKYSTNQTPSGYIGNYTYTVVDDVKFVGNKALMIAANVGADKYTHGFAAAQSPAISVVGSKEYTFDYTIKTVVESNINQFRGGLVFVCEYNSKGDLINRKQIGNRTPENVDWTSYSVSYVTLADAATVKLEFFLGGTNKYNYGAKFFIDEVSFAAFPDDRLLNGGFEQTKANGDLYSWYLRPCTNVNEDSTAAGYVANHELKLVSGKNGKAPQITKKGAGYVTLTSNMMKVTTNTTYVIDYAIKVLNRNEKSFLGARLDIAEFDKDQKLIGRIKMLGTNQVQDWTKYSTTYTPTKNAAYFRLELYCGDHDLTKTFTVQFDDVSVTSFTRNNAANSVHNGNFEEVYEGTIFDWSFTKVAGTSYSSTFDGYTGKGLHIKRRSDVAGYGSFQSNKFEVKAGQQFKASYMVRLDNKEGTVYVIQYAKFYDKDGKQVDSQRCAEFDYRLKSLEWSRTQGVFNVPEGAVTCQLSYRINGTCYDCYIDDVMITYTNPGETNYGFNKADVNGEVYGWTVSYPENSRVDNKVYREGTGSLFISQFVDMQKTYVVCDTLIPVDSTLKYELTAWVKSYDCDISADGMVMNARCYDKDGNYLGVNSIVAGRHIVLSGASTPGEWREMICGLMLPKKAAYIRPIIEIPYGQVNLWIDDLKCTPYSLENEFYDDFDSVTNQGTPAGWDKIVEEGEPEFSTSNSITTIKAEDNDDIGTISARWETRMEYRNMKYSMVYATTGDTGAKVTIKFYGFNDKEIEADRIEKEFDSTDGEYQKIEFDFMLLSAKYMRIEISNTEDGTLNVEDLSVVSFEEEKSDEDEIGWRGYWIWHDENYKDSINGTSRYFRCHFTLDEIPVASILQISADDRLKVFVNGVRYEEDNMNKRFTEVSVLDNIHESLQIGDNVIAVEVWNFTAYAGLLFDGFAEYESGERVDFFSTTGSVISSNVLEEGWSERTFDDSKWTPTMFMDYNANTVWPEDLIYDKSPFIKEKFEIVDYTLTESVIAGDDAVLNMTIIPQIDFKKDIDIVANLWIRNSQNTVMSATMKQLSGPSTGEWREGEQITVSFSLNIPDFIASGKYIIQLDTNQVVITNYDIFNNKLIKAINVTNNAANQQMKVELVQKNGTNVVSIDGKIYPFQMYNKQNSEPADKSKTTQYMHDAGICITMISTPIAKDTSASYIDVWTGIDEYNWSVLDQVIYKELALHPDTYIMPSLYLSVRDWWCAQNPDELIVDSNGDVHNLTMFSEKGIQVALKANTDMLEHMMSQPYWNRIVGFNLNGFGTSEWMWYAKGPTYTIDHSKAATTYFREWLTKKYGTDAELQKAWNDKTVTLATAVNPPYEEHQNEKYDSIYDPQVNMASLDYIQCQEEREIDLVSRFHTLVAEVTNESRIQGSYFGYLYTRGFYENANRSMNSKIDMLMDNPHIDYMMAPPTYSDRFDGEAAAMCQMIDGVLKHGKAVVLDDDYRACGFVNDAQNYYNRDSVGTNYNMSDSISAFLKVQALTFTQGASHNYFDIEGMMYEREQFSRIFEVLLGEKYIDISREKSYTGEVAYIMDEDGYDYNSTGKDGSAIYDATYELIFEQKHDLAKMGVMTDYYSMSDLVRGLVPDYKVYVMINTVEIDAEEKAAIEKYLKNKDKVVLWQWLAGASDGKKIDAKNMSDVIGMDVKFDTSEMVLKSIIANKEHWLTEGVEGKSMGSGLGYRVASPVAYVTDNDANIAKLGTMYENKNYTSLAVMENEDWTSVFSSVPGYNVYMLKNVLKHAGVHVYSDNPDDIIYANSNYVAINCAYGGEKSIKLTGTYAVYDVVGQTTYSTSTDVINITMDDNSTKIFRLMPVNTNIIYVNTMYQGTLEGEAYNEVMTGDDFSAKITADDGYVISQIITDTERKTINRSSYTVEFDDVDNSHYVRVIFAPAGSVEESADYLVYILIGAGVLLVAAAAVFFIIFLKKKKEKEVAEDAE